MRINCVIVDDEPANLKGLQQIVSGIDQVEVVQSFTDGRSFLDSIGRFSFDMCILDNQLPDINGVELAKRLGGKKIIFVSAHEVSASDAFDVNAVDVLKKPVLPERLEKAVRKCRDKIVQERGYVYLRTDLLGKTRFRLEDIVCVESVEGKKVLFTRDGESYTLGRTSFEEILEKLPETQFCALSKASIIGIAFLKAYKGKEVVVLDFKERGKNNWKELESSGIYLRQLKQKSGSESD
jgi:DNA-binding LytR/AlgR family response regulator